MKIKYIITQKNKAGAQLLLITWSTIRHQVLSNFGISYGLTFSQTSTKNWGECFCMAE